jgi:hypothetical protein
MRIERDLQTHIRAAFEMVNDGPAGSSFPPPATLSNTLNKAIPPGATVHVNRRMVPGIAKMFTTASVNMWMRSVHSFLVSSSLTNVSPVWASVSGYYSSHYSVRAMAHLLGFFQLFGRKRIVRLELQGGQFVCSMSKSAMHDREHRFYWHVVKGNSLFASDPFFTQNESTPDQTSDVAHRDFANYVDHLPHFPVFHPLDAALLRARVDRISEIEFNAPPVPQVSQYPDLDSVQIIAYHRIVRFRDLLDTILGISNRFWNVHRDPAWAREFMDFQLTEELNLRAEFSL